MLILGQLRSDLSQTRLFLKNIVTSFWNLYSPLTYANTQENTMSHFQENILKSICKPSCSPFAKFKPNANFPKIICLWQFLNSMTLKGHLDQKNTFLFLLKELIKIGRLVQNIFYFGLFIRMTYSPENESKLYFPLFSCYIHHFCFDDVQRPR